MTQSCKNTSNLPDDVVLSQSGRNVDPEEGSQSREERMRRIRRLEASERAMMLWRDRGQNKRGQRHCDYNYQLNSMVTLTCELASFPH